MATRNLKSNSQKSIKQAEDLIRKTSKELSKSYQASLNEIRAAISRVYEQYLIPEAVTKAEAAQILRASGIVDEINRIMAPYIRDNIDLLKEASLKSFDDGFLINSWAIDQASGVSLGWGLIDDTAVRAAVGIGGDISDLEQVISAREAAKHKKILDKALANYTKDSRKWISREVREGIIKGESVDKVAGRVGKIAGVKSQGSAERIARTEILRSSGIGSQSAYDDARDKGINIREVWDATLDDRTRPDHAVMDGEVMDNETMSFSAPWGASPGPRRNGIAEQDINCRCTTVPEIEGYAPELRRIRGEGVQPYKTFKSWSSDSGLMVNRYGQKYDL